MGQSADAGGRLGADSGSQPRAARVPRPRLAWWRAGGGEGLLVARSLCAQAAGDELLVSYGAQADLIFGMHYGFVPPTDEARLRTELDAVRAELVEEGAGADAASVREAARVRLAALERGEEVSRAVLGHGVLRSCCATLAQALRQSERRVLQRLCSTDGRNSESSV